MPGFEFPLEMHPRFTAMMPNPSWSDLIRISLAARMGARTRPIIRRRGVSGSTNPAHQLERNSADLNLISGESGIGKSRLARTLAERISGESYTPLHLQCSPFHTNIALYPIIEHFERVAGFTAYCRWVACSPSAGAQRKAGPRRIMSSSATCGQT